MFMSVAAGAYFIILSLSPTPYARGQYPLIKEKWPSLSDVESKKLLLEIFSRPMLSHLPLILVSACLTAIYEGTAF